MLKSLMLRKKIDEANKELEELRKVDFESRSSELEQAIEDAKTDEELRTVEESIDELDEEKESHDKEVRDLEEKIEELEEELRNLVDNAPKKDKKRGKNMDNQEIRTGINQYVKSKGQVREGFTSVEGGALIPEELLTPKKALEDIVNLKNLVNSTKVSSSGGKYPVIKKSGSKMNTVAELEKNPELAKPTITEVDYSIDTYRGYIPVSQEVIDDADYDITGLIADEIKDQELNTINVAIADVLKGAQAEDVEGIDGLKEVFNVKLKKAYNAKAIISASFYNALDTVKDKAGRYLLQDDITTSSGKRLLGKEVVVLDDEVIGEESGDMVGFIGDPKEFMTFFDRKQTSVKWVDHNVYGQLLAGFIRFDVKEVDSDAGFYVTYSEQTEETP